MITIPEIAEKLNKTERAIQMQISKLQARELIARIGPAKGGHWEVLKWVLLLDTLNEKRNRELLSYLVAGAKPQTLLKSFPDNFFSI